MTTIEAMKQALEALETLVEMTGTDIYRDAKNALRQAIATEESSATQEPVAWNGKPLTWKLVPTVPTQAMLDEMNLTGREGYDEVMGDGFSASLYHAALIASPAQPKAEQEPEKYALDIECERCGAKQSGVLTVHTHPQPKAEQDAQTLLKEIAHIVRTKHIYGPEMKKLLEQEAAITTNTQPKAEQEPKREWVGLTKQEIRVILESNDWTTIPARLIWEAEAKLKQKNT